MSEKNKKANNSLKNSDLVSRIQQLEQIINIKEEEVERLKASFLSNISHEIRTPMNAIMGFSNLLKDPNITDDERNSFIECINDSSKNLLKIINNLILTAKSESEKIHIKECECVVNDLLKEIEKKHNNELHLIGNNNLKVKFANNHKKKLLIRTDKEKLKTILSNLIDNALKFTNEGKVIIGFEIIDEDIKFFVKDSGIGIPEEKQKSIFNKFTQIEETRTRSYGGLGIGLTISNNLVQCLGGKMTLSSSVGKGSEFTFTIPCKPITENKKLFKNIFNNSIYTTSEQFQPVTETSVAENKNIEEYTLFSYAHNFRA